MGRKVNFATLHLIAYLCLVFSCAPPDTGGTGNGWTDLNFPLIAMPVNVRIAADSLNNLIVVNDEWDMGIKLHIRRFNAANSVWQDMGNFSCSILGGNPCLVIDNNDVPVVRYTMNDSGQTAVVKWQSGTVWQTYNLLTSLGVDIASFLFDSSNNPVIAFVDAAGDSKIHVIRWNGSAWDDYGFTSVGVASLPALALDSDDNPSVCFIDDADSYKPHVVKYQSGTTWTDLGFPGPATTGAHDRRITIEIDSQKKPVVCLSATWCYSTAIVKRWNSGLVWDELGELGSEAQSGGPSLALDSSDKPIALIVTSGTHALSYQSASAWNDLGRLGFGNLSSASLTLVSSDTPVVAFVDDNDNAVHVWRKK